MSSGPYDLRICLPCRAGVNLGFALYFLQRVSESHKNENTKVSEALFRSSANLYNLPFLRRDTHKSSNKTCTK